MHPEGIVSKDSAAFAGIIYLAILLMHTGKSLIDPGCFDPSVTIILLGAIHLCWCLYRSAERIEHLQEINK